MSDLIEKRNDAREFLRKKIFGSNQHGKNLGKEAMGRKIKELTKAGEKP